MDQTSDQSTSALDRRGAAPSDLVVTRSEEQLRVDVTRRPYQRVRVRRTVVTETVTQTVQVRREEIHVDTEPVDDAAGVVDLGGLQASRTEPGVLEVVLREERPVTQLVVVPVERVRVLTELVTEQRVVRGDVRAERIDLVGPGGGAAGGGAAGNGVAGAAGGVRAGASGTDLP